MCTCMCTCACVCIYACARCVLQRFRTHSRDADLFGKIRTCYRRFRFVPVMNLIHRRFEDRSMGWSADSYRFVQWTPDGNSVPKLRHFMWVFVLMLILYLLLLVCVYMLLLSFHMNDWYILPVWLPVSLHEISVSINFNYVFDLSAYQYHFMGRGLPLLIQD